MGDWQIAYNCGSSAKGEGPLMQAETIHPDDDMFTGSLAHYEACGKQFALFAERAAELAGSSAPRILELPCGYGRVTRHLVKRFDPSRIEVADIMVPAVDYTAQTFGVKGHYVVDPVNEFRSIAAAMFDIAVMGSLLTHLSESDARTVLEHFLAKLARQGVAVVTTHGVRAHEMLSLGGWFEVAPEDKSALLSAYAAGSYGFANYTPEQPFEKKTVDYIGKSYGVSLTPHSWMLNAVERLGFRVLDFDAGAWDNHQDVFFIARRQA
ncbi:class I SAM-dependent methyltransferase [Paraburkholderia strydomiana]|uniref:class I SAM-dependent methyltransferase n=1 Tax=Paraburkholderia strydomiana TaxID=1245417 RepID=UPI0038B9A6F2